MNKAMKEMICFRQISYNLENKKKSIKCTNLSIVLQCTKCKKKKLVRIEYVTYRHISV